MMSIAEKEEYLKKNKHIKQGIGKINIVSGVMGVVKSNCEKQTAVGKIC